MALYPHFIFEKFETSGAGFVESVQRARFFHFWWLRVDDSAKIAVHYKPNHL
jgi:hypothetical protein